MAVWRVLDTLPAPGAWNMAVDEALVESVRRGGTPTLRFYRWAPLCLSLGRNQPAAGHYDAERMATAGVEVVRRLTGGRAVLHDAELTYSVVMPEGTLGSPRAAYTAVNRALVEGLRRLGVAAQLQPATPNRAPAPSLAPCFRDPAEGEVMAGGRKLIGSAQYREEGVVLQHGSLLLRGDQAAVSGFLRAPPPRCDPPPAGLADLLPRLPAWHELTVALRAGWAAVVGSLPQPGELSDDERAAASRHAARYADPAWTWRR